MTLAYVAGVLLQISFNASQSHAKDLESKLDTQVLRSSQLEAEVLTAQSHIAELSAILKSAGRPVSRPAGLRSPGAESLSQEHSAAEAAPRLRSQELQGNLYACFNEAVVTKSSVVM